MKKKPVRTGTSRLEKKLDKMLATLMNEIACVNREIRKDMAIQFKAVHTKFDVIDQRFTKVESRLDNLNAKTDRNFLTFMNNHDKLEHRVTVLETAV